MYRTSWGTRPLYLQTAAELGLTRPLTGWGPGTFAHGWSVEAPPRVILHAARAGWTFAAHCEPAQVVAELGLPGLLLWVGVVSAAVAGAWRASRDRDGRADRGGLPLLLVLGGLLCDGLFSPAYRHMDTGFLFAFLLGGGLAGWARREAAPAATPAPGPPVWSRVLGVALLTVLAGRAVVGVQAQLLLGRALRHGTAGAYDDAAEKARRAAGLALDLPLWRRCQQTLARAELHRGEHAAAAAAAEELRRVLPAHPRALDLLLQATYELGEPKLYFRRRIVALRYRSFDPDLRAGLHRFLARLEPAALARWRAELGAAEAPLSWLTEADWNLLAAIVHFDGEGDPDAALSRVAELRPEEARLLPLRAESGRLLTLLGMEEQAAGVLAPAAEVIPPDPVALYWLAVVRARQGRMEKAGALLAECLAWDPDLPEAAIAYSRYLLARGDAAGRQAAPGVLRQAIARRPGHVDLRVALVRTLWSLGRRDAARRALAAALDRLPAAEALMDLRRSLPPPGPTGELKSD
jgi:tetratricopeptide (TPR) repeat protein